MRTDFKYLAKQKLRSTYTEGNEEIPIYLVIVYLF
jgi:hypothetical protein